MKGLDFGGLAELGHGMQRDAVYIYGSTMLHFSTVFCRLGQYLCMGGGGTVLGLGIASSLQSSGLCSLVGMSEGSVPEGMLRPLVTEWQ